MQSLYWVLTWACHRKCAHCYDDRFRPYVRGALTDVVAEGQRAYDRVLANLPDDMSWTDAAGKRQPTLIVLAGGELLIDGVREALFYPVLEAIRRRWPDAPPRLSVQTTGDILEPDHIDAMLSRGVTTIAIASIDDYHVGMKGERKFRFMDKVRAMMAEKGVREVSLGGGKSEKLKSPDPAARPQNGEPTFLFFGAQPDLWIGELWPRGRAWETGFPMRATKPISARAGRAGRTSSSCTRRAARSPSSRMGLSTRVASRPGRRSDPSPRSGWRTSLRVLRPCRPLRR
jgi:hypothetical protein